MHRHVAPFLEPDLFRFINAHNETACFRFTIGVIMNGRQFPAIESTNKKDGRKEAADLALRILMAEGAYQDTKLPSVAPLVRENLSLFITHKCIF